MKQPQRWTAGFDYLRLTYTADAGEVDDVYARYIRAAQEVAYNYSEEAPTPKAWSFQGYEGTHWGEASAGRREDGCILQVSGSWASAVRLLELPHTGVPRLDIQATVWGYPQPALVPGEAAAASVIAREGANGRPWRVAHICGFGNGDTCYIGSRQSDVFARIYDKGAQDESNEDYAGAVRYEVELKGRTASAAFAALARAGGDEVACADWVQSYLLARGLSLPEWVSVETVRRRAVEKAASSTDETLAWLANGVRPTVRRLLDAGLTYELLHRILFGQPAESGLDWLDKTDGGHVVSIGTKLRP